jgi:uroporphyrinogen-III synthase
VRLLVTRPQADGERTAAKLRALGHVVEVAPLLRLEPAERAEIGAGPFGAIAITSANALHAVVRHPRGAELRALPVFTVGRRTAEAARAMGFLHVASADGNQQDLVRLIRAHLHGGAPLLYLAGEDRSGDLAGDLAGIAVQTVVAYRAIAAPEFSAVVRDALAQGRIDGVLHFSRRSAEAFVGCAAACGIRETALALSHFCLSRQVAEPLSAAGATTIRIASRPEEEALIALVTTP